MKNDYKLLFIKSGKFFVTLLLVDLIFGFAARQVYFSQKTGKQARITHTIANASSEIFIFGSSHANRHYIPKIFEEELELTTHNAGVQGQGIIFHNALQKIVLKRIKPKLIILNIDYNWLYEREDAYERLSDFNPYYWQHREIIKPVISIKSKFSDVKLLLKAYQNNSTIVHAIRYFFSPQKDYNGYLPLSGSMENPKKIITHLHQQEQLLDKNFINAFSSFIQSAKRNDIDLLLVLSPLANNENITNTNSMKKMKEIATEEKIPLINLNGSSHFKKKYYLFNDASHLNDKGATLFSKIITDYIKKE